MKLEDTLNYRSGWMGFAILWVMLLHAEFTFDSEILRVMQRIGYGGVDIFLFASGLGCSYSLKKNPDIAAFLKRRAVRILPTWWVFLILLWLCREPLKIDWSLNAYVGNFLLVQAFIDWHFCFNWYLSALLFTYLLAPYCFALCERESFSWRMLLIVEGILLLLCFAFLHHDYLILISRLPIFFVGFYFARLARRGAIITTRAAIGLLSATAFGFFCITYLWHHYPEQTLTELGLWWYPFIILTPGLCVGISFAMSRLMLLDKILSTVGRFSLEIFLMHLAWALYFIQLPNLSNADWVVWFALSMTCGVLLKLFMSRVSKWGARR